MMSIVVFGSLNMDIVVRTPALPRLGQTITGTDFRTVPGGKGANQAVACARLDAPTVMVGRVGNDAYGKQLIQSLGDAGVDTEAVQQDAAATTGIAQIAVDEQGQNTIIIVAGANGRVDASDVERLEAHLRDASVLLLQLEVPLAATVAAAQAAARHNVPVMLDPAPAVELPAALYPLLEIITPNETETEILTGIAVTDETTAAQAATALLARGVSQVVVKMGAKGAYWTNGEESAFFPAMRVNTVDTVAAGDAFNGGLAVALHERQSMPDAIRFATRAAALSTTKSGAQDAMPTRPAVDDFAVGLRRQTRTDASTGDETT